MDDRKNVRWMLALALAAGAPPAAAQDWPMWGRDETRNMASPVTGLLSDFSPGKFVGTSDQIDAATTKNVKWIAKLGSQSYGNVTVANGRVYVVTNNDVPRDPKYQGDRCAMYCLDEETGGLVWQVNVPKLGTGKVSDWEYLGICSSAAVEGDRAWFLTNRCEVVCADTEGFLDGKNDGTQEERLETQGGSAQPPEEEREEEGERPH